MFFSDNPNLENYESNNLDKRARNFSLKLLHHVKVFLLVGEQG